MGATRYSRPLTLLAAATLALGVTATTGAAAARPAGPGSAGHASAARAGCVLGTHGAIRHVIYLMFDNTHYTRDNPSVPSDLQPMPNRLDHAIMEVAHLETRVTHRSPRRGGVRWCLMGAVGVEVRTCHSACEF